MPELVLLPGMDGTGRLFEPFIAALAGGIPTRVMTYPESGFISYPELTSWIREQLPASDFVLLGESFAGPVAASLAAERPDGLLGLILCSTFVRNPRPKARYLSGLIPLIGTSRMAARFFSPVLLGLRPDDELRRQFIESVGDMASLTLRQRLRSVLAVDVSESLSRVDVPVLCLRATRDVLVPRSAADWMRHVLPTAQTVDVHGPHGLLQVSPGPCARVVWEFVKNLERAGVNWTDSHSRYRPSRKRSGWQATDASNGKPRG